MAQALNFDKALQRALCDRLRGYSWFQPWRADEHSIVDVAGFKGGKLTEDQIEGRSPSVIVEVELKKDNPVENVVKIWNWGRDRNGNSKRLLFVQAFSAHYFDAVSASNSSKAKLKAPSKTKQYERAKFIGEEMKKDRSRQIDYAELLIVGKTRGGEPKPYKPLLRRGVIVKVGGGAMRRAARELARDIKRLMRRKSYL